jgi:hypothetical protein
MMIFLARNSDYIFAAQCIWGSTSIIQFQQGSVTLIDNLQIQANIGTGEAFYIPTDLQKDQ